METVLLIIVIVLIIALFTAFVVNLKKIRKASEIQDTYQKQMELLKQKMTEENKEFSKYLTDTTLKMQQNMTETMKSITDGVSSRLGENKQSMDNTNKRLDTSAEYMLKLEKRLSVLGEKTESLSNIGKEINRIADIFQSPKLRGNLGELILENLLDQILPSGTYEKQYMFKNDRTKVDAAIKIGGKIVPVDAKFPFENFKRFYSNEISDKEKIVLKKEFYNDVKKHIDSISQKYIKPEENTFDFALMYIPSETIYYEIIAKDEVHDNGKSIIDYAGRKNVIPVSPNSFFAYLQVIVFGLKGMEIEKSAKEIQERLKKIQIDFAKFYNHFTKIGTKIEAVQKEYEQAQKRFELLDKKVERATGTESLLLNYSSGSDD